MQYPFLFKYALVSAFVCTDYACPWESREAWGLHLLYFQMFKTSLLDEGCQILHAASPSVKARSLACSFLLALEIGNDQATSWFEHTSDFRESLTLEARRQMMHHQGREHHIDRLIGEGDLLDHPDLELDGHVAPSCFRAGMGDLLCPRVNAYDAARTAHAACHFQRQRSRAAAHIQHRISRLNTGQVGGSLPELPKLSTERKDVMEPSRQVVTPALVEDQSFGLFGRRLGRLAVAVTCERMHRSHSFQRKPLFCCADTVGRNKVLPA